MTEKIDKSSLLFRQTPSKWKVTCEETENSEYIMHSLGALDDSCFMAFPMRQDSIVNCGLTAALGDLSSPPDYTGAGGWEAGGAERTITPAPCPTVNPPVLVRKPR
ncbi:unnamed protein product [Pleuronectes platessa]|uniref:Uncharacterized protein n=1 Tax=Pleuronectes platessa TaxID=8262 RepID=A0A9N7VID6_PLEPL|nr:unnamed protein product [Pleuronectes platessa]